MANKFDYSGDGTLGRLLTRLKSTLAGYAKQSEVSDLSEAIADYDTLTLGMHTDGLMYIFKGGKPLGMGVELPDGGGLGGYIDSENNVVLTGNYADGTLVKYEMEDGTVIDIGGVKLYYTVTNKLTNCTNSNSATQVISGQAYTATITPKSGYELKSVTVTMGGNAVSVSGGNINIAKVTGDIVITAVSEEVKPTYTNLADPSSSDWWTDSMLGSDGTQRTGQTGYIVSNYIGPVNAGDIIYIKGMDLTGTTSQYRCAPCKSDKTLHGSFGTGALSTLGGLSTKPITNVTVTATGGQFTNNNSDIKYWRIGGKPNGAATDVIITINEPIV